MNIKNFSFLVLLALISKTSLFSPPLTYTEQTGEKKLHTSWTMKEKKNEIWIEGRNEEILTTMCFFKDWSLKSYKIFSQKEDTEYEFIKNEKEILAQGKIKGKPIEQSHDIQNSHWVEHFGFGLLPFLESKDKKYNFYSLNPNDFSLVPMVAYKEIEEIIQIGSKDTEALKIKITLPGFKSMFWSANLWFSKENHLFLKYEGNSGPNTPLTKILYEKGSVKIP